MNRSTFTVALVALACTRADPQPAPRDLVVVPHELNALVGAAQQLSALAYFDGGVSREVTNEVIWTSDDPAIAGVGATGVMAGYRAGTTTITAALGTRTATANVSITSEAFREAMVSITFDDGKSSQLPAAAALVEHGFRGTFYVVTAWSSQALAGCMTLEDLRQLAAAGHEIGSHTVYHPHLPEMDDSRAALELSASRDWLQQNVGATSGRSFASPFGEFDWRVLGSAWKLYRVHRTTSPYLNYPDTNREKLGVYGTPTVGEARRLVDRAIGERSWLIFSFHEIAESAGGSGYPLEDFSTILDYLRERGVRVVTIADAVPELDAPAAPPAIVSLTPSVGAVTGSTTVEVAGTGFAEGAAVFFGDVPGEVLAVMGTQIRVNSPAHVTGVVDITVSNPDGQSSNRSAAFVFSAEE